MISYPYSPCLQLLIQCVLAIQLLYSSHIVYPCYIAYIPCYIAPIQCIFLAIQLYMVYIPCYIALYIAPIFLAIQFPCYNFILTSIKLIKKNCIDEATISHQKQNNQCGIYAIYFIKKMLEGMSFDKFLKSGLSDSKMKSLRNEYFLKL